MKTLILTALIGATIISSNANETTALNQTMLINSIETPTRVDEKTQVFLDRLVLHQRNIDVVWQQYEQAIAKIKTEPGSVSDLQLQMNTLMKYYEDDITQGVRVEDSKKAIAEIRKMYGKKIEKQLKNEKKEIARIQGWLSRELDREERAFNALKEAYAEQVNAHTEPLIRSVERQFSHSSVRLDELDDTASLTLR